MQGKDGYSLKEDTQNNEPNNFVHYRDTNKGWSKLSFRIVVVASRVVVASSVGEQSSSKKCTAAKA